MDWFRWSCCDSAVDELSSFSIWSSYVHHRRAKNGTKNKPWRAIMWWRNDTFTDAGLWALQRGALKVLQSSEQRQCGATVRCVKEKECVGYVFIHSQQNRQKGHNSRCHLRQLTRATYSVSQLVFFCKTQNNTTSNIYCVSKNAPTLAGCSSTTMD